MSLYFIIFLLCFKIYTERNLIEEELEELSDDIIILHTNDVHCGIDDTIGYDGLNLYRKELKMKYKHVLLVDAGDNIQGGAIGVLSKGKDVINIMNFLEYDVVTIGNHEFDYKIEQFFNLSHMIKAGYICANFLFRKTQTTVFPPYKIIEVGDISIGFIGIITPQALTKSYLHTLVDEDGNLIYDFLTEREGHELYETIQKYIDELRQVKKVNYVIIVAHMGYGGDASVYYTSPALLANINGVDAIIDGHTHLEYNNTFPDKDGKQIHISQTGTKLNKVGKITIKTDGTITSELIGEIPLFEGYDSYYTVNRSGVERYVDKDTYKFVEDIIESHSHEFEEIVGYSDFDLLINSDKGPIIRCEEITLGDLVTDAIRTIGNSDIGFINAGSIRKSIKKGNITFNHILNTLPFSARIIVKNILGKDILDALEFSTKNLPNTTSTFLQVSGIKFKVDVSFKSNVVIDEFENFVKVDGERRVFDVYIGEEKLYENKAYSISFDDYLAEGGDGFSMFGKYKMAKDTFLLDNEALKKYLENDLNKIIPDIYKTTQGRIVRKEKFIPPDTDSDIPPVTDSDSDSDSGVNSNTFIKYLRELSLLLLFVMI